MSVPGAVYMCSECRRRGGHEHADASNWAQSCVFHPFPVEVIER